MTSTQRSSLVAAAAVVAASAIVAAQDGSRGQPAAGAATPGLEETELSPAARERLDGGLRWLAAHQGAGGTVGGEGKENQEVASTALAGLAWLAAGSSENRGPYCEQVKKAVQYLHTIRARSGRPGLFDPGHAQGRMHAHGFATLFVGELYGMTKGGARADSASPLRRALDEAVKLSLASQTKKGGWGYSFSGEPDFATYNQDEASTTITQIQALRSARNAGIKVPAAAIEKAVEYVRKSMRNTVPKGAARYSLTSNTKDNDRTSFELTAAAVSTLNASGVYDSPELQAGLAYLKKEMGKKPNRLEASTNYYFYGNFYAAQAMFQAGGEDWKAWFKDAQQDLVEKSLRSADGTFWKDPRTFGDGYSTASACLILALPLRYLPIFER